MAKKPQGRRYRLSVPADLLEKYPRLSQEAQRADLEQSIALTQACAVLWNVKDDPAFSSLSPEVQQQVKICAGEVDPR